MSVNGRCKLNRIDTSWKSPLGYELPLIDSNNNEVSERVDVNNNIVEITNLRTEKGCVTELEVIPIDCTVQSEEKEFSQIRCIADVFRDSSTYTKLDQKCSFESQNSNFKEVVCLDHSYSISRSASVLKSLPVDDKGESIKKFISQTEKRDLLYDDFWSLLKEPQFLPLSLNLDEDLRPTKLKYQIGDVVFVNLSSENGRALGGLVECSIERIAAYAKRCYLVAPVNDQQGAVVAKYWIPESDIVKKKKKYIPRMITLPGNPVVDVGIQVAIIQTADFDILNYHQQAENLTLDNLIEQNMEDDDWNTSNCFFGQSSSNFANSPPKPRPNRVPYCWNRQVKTWSSVGTQSDADVSWLCLLLIQDNDRIDFSFNVDVSERHRVLNSADI